MTKKDFNLIAKTLAASKTSRRVINYDQMCRAVSVALQTTNKNFNREKFLKTCGVTK